MKEKLFKKCKKCSALISLKKRKGLCYTCYNHDYIVNRWKNDKKYRKAQTARTISWMKKNPERVKKIVNKAVKKYLIKKKNEANR